VGVIVVALAGVATAEAANWFKDFVESIVSIFSGAALSGRISALESSFKREHGYSPSIF
jgi:hypothetical protein